MSYKSINCMQNLDFSRERICGILSIRKYNQTGCHGNQGKQMIPCYILAQDAKIMYSTGNYTEISAKVDYLFQYGKLALKHIMLLNDIIKDYWFASKWYCYWQWFKLHPTTKIISVPALFDRLWVRRLCLYITDMRAKPECEILCMGARKSKLKFGNKHAFLIAYQFGIQAWIKLL